MPTQTEYALMADGAYRDIRSATNRPVDPVGWVKLERIDFGIGPSPSASGFSAEIFTNGIEIVIAIGGTNPGGQLGDFFVDWVSNFALG